MRGDARPSSDTFVGQLKVVRPSRVVLAEIGGVNFLTKAIELRDKMKER
jgi:hypothetical protein